MVEYGSIDVRENISLQGRDWIDVRAAFARKS
jgi:hypothetical protein